MNARGATGGRPSERAASDECAADAHKRQAEESIARLFLPVITQAEQFGFEAVALGLRAAISNLPALKSVTLFSFVAPVPLTGWIEAWARVLASRAPRLRHLRARFVAERTHGVSLPGCLQVSHLLLVGSTGEHQWMRVRGSEPAWTQDSPGASLAGLRSLTGANLETPGALGSFLEELSALMLLLYRSTGAVEFTMLEAAAPEAAKS